MFKRMLSAFGVGGPSVDTVLDSPRATPGQIVTGQVRIQGGNSDVEIDRVVLSLVTRVEVEHGGHESAGVGEFHRLVLQQDVRVPVGQLVSVPFQLPIPWETPITAVGNSPLPGMTVGVRTELVIAGAPDKGDLDPIHVHPLSSQDRVLDAFGQLGFRYRKADVEVGHLHGVRQELGFYQEIEFFPPAQVTGRINQVELTFVANPHELYVVLEADKRGGMFRSGGDSFGHFHMSHQEAQTTDWAALVGQWLTQVAEHGGNVAFGGQPGYGHHGRHGRGVGMGGVVAGAAAGVVGGMVLGEVFEDGGEEFFGDDEG
jgi:sporulation-control protein